MNRQLLTCLAVVSVCISSICMVQAQTENTPVLAKKKLAPLMQMKLDRSKSILEGLALEDYEKISKNARALRLLSLESGWNILQTDEYAQQSLDFRRNTALIAESADEKDLSRAALGYVALTVRCVECHSYMRKTLAEHQEDNEQDK